MKISMVVGDALMFKYLAYMIKKEMKEELIQVIVENTYSKESFIKQIKFRIKKYGILKFVDEVFYRLFENFVQKSSYIYEQNFKEANSLNFDYLSKNINDSETEQVLKSFNPDILVVFGTSIVKKHIFCIPKYGTINIHPGINPKYKGAGSFWALKNQDFENYGFTIHLVDDGIDTGEVISSKIVKFKNPHKVLPNMYSDLTKEAINELINILQFTRKNKTLPKNKPLTNDEGYYTWLGLSDYIKMRWNLRDVRV